MNGWMWMTLGLGMVAGTAQAAPSAAARQAGRELVASLEPGVGGGGPGFKLTVRGGRPLEPVLMVLQPRDGAPVVQALRLDEQGAAERVVRHWPQGLEARAWFAPGGGAVGLGISNQVELPGRPEADSFELQRGDLVITEFMKDPKFVSDSNGEWLEVYNASGRVLNIEGCILEDAGTNWHRINDLSPNRMLLAPGQYFVLGINADFASNGGVLVDYEYSGFTLTNGADEITLRSRAGELIDVVRYDDGVFWPDSPGKSISLGPPSTHAGLNDLAASWCHGTTAIGGGNTDLGTPGAANDPCP